VGVKDESDDDKTVYCGTGSLVGLYFREYTDVSVGLFVNETLHVTEADSLILSLGLRCCVRKVHTTTPKLR